MSYKRKSPARRGAAGAIMSAAQAKIGLLTKKLPYLAIGVLVSTLPLSAQMRGGVGNVPIQAPCKNLPDAPCHPGDHLRLAVSVDWNPNPPADAVFTSSLNLRLVTKRQVSQSALRDELIINPMYGATTDVVTKVQAPGMYVIDVLVPPDMATGKYQVQLLRIAASFSGGELHSEVDSFSSVLNDFFVYVQNDKVAQAPPKDDHIRKVTTVR